MLALVVFIYAVLGMQLFAVRRAAVCVGSCVPVCVRGSLFPLPCPVALRTVHWFISRVCRTRSTTRRSAQSSTTSTGRSSPCRRCRSAPARVLSGRAHAEGACIGQILTGDEWNTVMYAAADGTTRAAVIYFCSLLIVGCYLILNIFIAILLGNFKDQVQARTAAAECGAQSLNLRHRRRIGKCSPSSPTRRSRCVDSGCVPERPARHHDAKD
jgi:hypothetical protein